MDTIQLLILGAIIVIVLMIVFRRYASALLYDYGVDCLLSFADYLLAGAGALGLDIGDWIAAVIIFSKEKKISSVWIAAIVAWEATNFLPVSLIPGIGEVVEIIFNFFPAVTISRIMFSKYGAADREEKKLEKDIAVAEQVGFNVSGEKEVLEQSKKMIEKNDPVDALKKEEQTDEEIVQELTDYTKKLITSIYGMIENIKKQNLNFSPETMEQLQNGVKYSEELLEKSKNAAQSEAFYDAIQIAMEAKKNIIAITEQFNNSYQQQQSELMMNNLRK